MKLPQSINQKGFFGKKLCREMTLTNNFWVNWTIPIWPKDPKHILGLLKNPFSVKWTIPIWAQIDQKTQKAQNYITLVLKHRMPENKC